MIRLAGSSASGLHANLMHKGQAEHHMETFNNTFLPAPDTNMDAMYEPNRWYSIGQMIPLTHDHIRIMHPSAKYLCTFGKYWNAYSSSYPLTRTGDTFRIGVETYKITNGPVMVATHQVYIYTQWRISTDQNEFPSGLTGSQRHTIRSTSAHMYMKAFTYYARDAFVNMLSKHTIVLNLAVAIPHAVYKDCMRACTTSVARVLTTYDDDDLMDMAIRKLVPSLKGITRKDVAKLCLRAREGFVAMWRYNHDDTKNTYMAWIPLDILRIIAALCIDAPSFQ
jgi:hypothetical protein